MFSSFLIPSPLHALVVRLAGFIPSHSEISFEEKSSLRGPSREVCSLSGASIDETAHKVVE